MTRIPVPDDFERSQVVVAGRRDSHARRASADVTVDADHARPLQVRRDADGRYVGCGTEHAEAVAAFLGVDVDASPDADADADADTSLNQQTDDDTEALVKDGTCPWCGDEFGNVASHASQVHPGEWAEYTEGD